MGQRVRVSISLKEAMKNFIKEMPFALSPKSQVYIPDRKAKAWVLKCHAISGKSQGFCVNLE